MANRTTLATVLFLAAAIFSIYAACATTESHGSENFPRRIISLGPLNTENVFLLGAGDRLVADTVYCVRPAEAAEKEKIGTLMEINLEKIAALHPDIVLATGLTRPGNVTKLISLGIRVERFEKPDSFDALCNHLLRLGALLGCERQAQAIVKEVRSKVRCVRDVTEPLPVQKVLLQVGANPLFAAAKGSFTDDYIRYSGGENIAGNQHTGRIRIEKVLARNPDVIIIAIMGTESAIALAEKEKWMHFRQINAVKNHRVYTVSPDIICSPSPVTFLKALYMVAGLVHPEADFHVAPPLQCSTP